MTDVYVTKWVQTLCFDFVFKGHLTEKRALCYTTFTLRKYLITKHIEYDHLFGNCRNINSAYFALPLRKS